MYVVKDLVPDMNNFYQQYRRYYRNTELNGNLKTYSNIVSGH